MSKLRLLPYAVMTAGGMFAAIGGASAQSMQDINQRQERQQREIERGVRDGQITRGEQARLEAGERAIDRAQRRAEADGRVTPQERERIERMTEREGREIRHDEHNRQQAWGRGREYGENRGGGWDRHDGRDGRREEHREADRRDGGRDHDGWNHTPTGGTPAGGRTHNPNSGSTTPTPPATAGNGNGNGNGGWNRGPANTGPATPPHSGTTTANNGGTTGQHGWGSQTRSASYTNYAAANTGARSAGSFGGGRHR